MFRLTLLVLVAALLIMSLESKAIKRCDIDSSQSHETRMARSSEDLLRVKKKAKKAKAKVVTPPIYEVRVVVNVLMDPSGVGYVPLDSIRANIDSANSVFSGLSNSRGSGFDARIRMFLSGVTYTNNSDFFYKCSDYNVAGQLKFYTSLTPATHVNIWTCYSDSLLGWVHYLPYELSQWSMWNGVNINYKSLPLSKTDPKYENYGDYADGDTMTHEFGHYLGLLHTFGDGVNGCTRGDNIDDTPAEASPTSGNACRASPPKDTCPDLPGLDPVWNIMDYADDTCAEEFTSGQVDVMRDSVENYKTSLVTLEPAKCVADGLRGTARVMTVCKSECFVDRTAPDGRSAPSNGWCRTDVYGNWGTCCCTGECQGVKPVVPAPKTLPCGRVQVREELLKPTLASRTCVTADIGGGSSRQLYQTTCNQTPFVRWAFNFDGSIVSIGTSWCINVINYKSGSANGYRVGIAPCIPQSPAQKFNVLPAKGKLPTALSLVADPTTCLDGSSGSFQMTPCSKIPGQRWMRQSKPACNTIRKRAQCVSTTPVLGCACRWVGRKCMS